jgi:hypothetical protein
MKATEIFQGQIENIIVNFYAGIYQYRDRKVWTVENVNSFNEVKEIVTNMLRNDKNSSTEESQKDTFWATFQIEDGEELFEEIVRI